MFKILIHKPVDRYLRLFVTIKIATLLFICPGNVHGQFSRNDQRLTLTPVIQPSWQIASLADKASYYPSTANIDFSGKSDSINKRRLALVGGTHLAIAVTSFVALNAAWYKDYPRSSFHFFDDRREWNQVDKAGHVWTAYQLSRHSAETWRWAGFSRRKAAWYGGVSAFAFQSIIEMLDGFSAQWGFSIGDTEANLIGAGGYIAQELLFKQQLLQVKMGYRPFAYPTALQSRRDELFGKSLPEQLLKDYNSQRYWLSFNPKAMASSLQIPAWLNIAVGYSSDGLYGARQNQWKDAQENFIDRSDIPRVRRFYLSPDIDLTKIRTKKKLIKSVLFVLNMVKIPAPTLEYNSQGKFRFHALMF